MTNLSGKHASFWIDSTTDPTYPSLENRVIVDVAIIGGGIVGLTAATLLKKAGKTVAIIESKHVAEGVSGHTTAKVTILHKLIYADLIKQIGEQQAKLYAESNQAAVEQVATFVAEEQIDCDFSRQSSYTFAEPEYELDLIKLEVEAAQKLGLAASFATETSLPFAIAGAIKLDNQAQFHVRKYLLHLAKNITGDGSYLFENTRVQKVDEGDSCYVVTELGVITAKDVIVATNLPILNLGLFFAKTYPERSYIVGAKIDPEKAPVGMYIGSGEAAHSVRTTSYQDGLLLLVGGEGHKVGTVTNTEECYQKLESYARDRFSIETFDYRWSNQDMVSFDKLPYIGNLTPFNKHIYVATGFSLWGMSKGTMSAILLTDLILGKSNPYTDLYDSLRATPFVTAESIRQEVDVVTHWIGDRFKGLSSHSFGEVAKGEGKLLTIDKEKVAAYRDGEGTIHAVSATCTHLGGIVSWNSGEKSWDCPCHGARYSCDGKVIQGPAVKDLEQVVH